jgi:hypothetical protein
MFQEAQIYFLKDFFPLNFHRDHKSSMIFFKIFYTETHINENLNENSWKTFELSIFYFSQC